MRVLASRYKDELDEVKHIVLRLVDLGIYDEQKSDLIDNYGSDIIEEAEYNLRRLIALVNNN
ncbi:MAG: hypothetical protein RR406_00120 [Bacilli bacterium]